MEEKKGMIWATILSDQKVEKPHDTESKIFRKSEPVITKPVSPMSDTIPPVSEVNPKQVEQKTVPSAAKPLPQPPANIRELLPKNSIVEARFINEERNFFQFSLNLPDGKQFNAGHPSTGTFAKNLREKLSPDRKCLIKIGDWIEKKGRIWPFIQIMKLL